MANYANMVYVGVCFKRKSSGVTNEMKKNCVSMLFVQQQSWAEYKFILLGEEALFKKYN